MKITGKTIRDDLGRAKSLKALREREFEREVQAMADYVRARMIWAECGPMPAPKLSPEGLLSSWLARFRRMVRRSAKS